MHEPLRRRAEPSPSGIPAIELPGRLTGDPAWLLVESGFHLAREHEVESLFTTANGYAGTRGSLAERASRSRPATFVAGVFGMLHQPATGAVPDLVKTPGWTHLAVEVNGHRLSMEDDGTLEHGRVLDLRQGLLWRDWRYRTPDGRISLLCFLRLASLADRHLLLQSLLFSAENYVGPVRLESKFVPLSPIENLVAQLAPIAPTAAEDAAPEAILFEFEAPATGTRVALATVSSLLVEGEVDVSREMLLGSDFALERWDFEAELGKSYRLDRLVSLAKSRDGANPTERSLARLQAAVGKGVCDVVEAHCQAWEERWRGAEVEVDGDPEAQSALRFALYHLIATANPEDERVSIGARALTGESYKGHVFWDTDIFMLPFYIFTHPPTARALLMYRYHTLPGAREKARLHGYRGAMYAWESAADGHETTPSWVIGADGTLVRVLCGELEQHISADVAYGAWQYWQATADDRFFVEAGAEILLETARFWASRAVPGPDGRYHILNVIGPDEYHEGVDDNAFTNVMAQWNLARGLDAVRLLRAQAPNEAEILLERLQIAPEELDQWRAVSEGMYTGFDPQTGLFEQFRGFFDLEEIDLAAYEPRTAPMDVLLGRERTQEVQVVKQADAVMLIALLWDDFPPEVREANFRYYEPRTGHGSSLSPAFHALVAARLGDLALAADYYRQAAFIDLANNMGNAAGGVHAAALGGLWQATVLGFAGMRLRTDGLSFTPHLPAHWRRLRFPVSWRGRRLMVTATREPQSLEVQCDGGESMAVSVEEGPQVAVLPGRCYGIRRLDSGWDAWQEAGTPATASPPHESK